MQRLTYIQLLEQAHYDAKAMDLRELAELVQRIKALSPGLQALMPMLYVVDYTRRKYVLVEGPVQQGFGHRPEAFLEGGLDFLLHIYHPGDFALYNHRVFSANTMLLQRLQPADIGRHFFSYTFRVRTERGDWRTILQKGSYAVDGAGLPQYSFGMCLDITPFRPAGAMIHTVERMDDDGTLVPVLSECYYAMPDAGALSRRERDVLCWLAEGWSGKQIAGKLGLSENTVANHRKALLRKTGAKNVAGLVRFGFTHGLL